MHKKYQKIDRVDESVILCKNGKLGHMEERFNSRHAYREKPSEHHRASGERRRKSKSSENNRKFDVDLLSKSESKKQFLEKSKERRHDPIRREKTFVEHPKVHDVNNKHSIRRHSSEKHHEKRRLDTREKPKDVIFFSAVPNPRITSSDNKYEIKDLYNPKSRDEKRKSEHRRKGEISRDRNHHRSAHESSEKKEKRKTDRGESRSKKSKERQSKSPGKKQLLSNVDLGPYEKYFAIAEKSAVPEAKSREAKKVKHESRSEKAENRHIKSSPDAPAHVSSHTKRKRRTHLYPENHPIGPKAVESKAEDEFKNYFARIQSLIDEKLDVFINSKPKENYHGNSEDVEKSNSSRRKHHHRKHRKEEDDGEKLQHKNKVIKKEEYDNIVQIRNTSPMAQTSVSASAARRSKSKEEKSHLEQLQVTLHDNNSRSKGEGRTHRKNNHDVREENGLKHHERDRQNKHSLDKSKTRNKQDISLVLGHPRSCDAFSKAEASHSKRKQSLKEEHHAKSSPKTYQNGDGFQDTVLDDREISLRRRKEGSQERHSALMPKIEEFSSGTPPEVKHKARETNGLYKMLQAKDGHVSAEIFNRESVPSAHYRISKLINYPSVPIEKTKPSFIVQGIEPPSLECPKNTKDKRRDKKQNLECKVVSIIGIPSHIKQVIEAETNPSINFLNLSKQITKQSVESQAGESISVDLPSESSAEKQNKTKRFKHYYKYSRHLSSNSGNTSDAKTIVSDSYRRISDPSDYEENVTTQPPENEIVKLVKADVATMTDITEKKSVPDIKQNLIASKEVKCSYLNTLSSSNSEYSLRMDKKPECSKMAEFLKRIALTTKIQDSGSSRDSKNRILLKLTSNSEIIMYENSENRVYKSKSDVLKVTPYKNSMFEGVYYNKSYKNKFPSTSEEDLVKLYLKSKTKPKYNLKQVLLENNCSNIGVSTIKIMQNLFTDSELRITGPQNFLKNSADAGVSYQIIDPKGDYDIIEELPKKFNKHVTVKILPQNPKMCNAGTKTSVEKHISVETHEKSCAACLFRNSTENSPATTPCYEKKLHVKSESCQIGVNEERTHTPTRNIHFPNEPNKKTVLREIETNTEGYHGTMWGGAETAQLENIIQKKSDTRKLVKKSETANKETSVDTQLKKEIPLTPKNFIRKPYTPTLKSPPRREKSVDRNTKNNEEAVAYNTKVQVKKDTFKETNQKNVVEEDNFENYQGTERIQAPRDRCLANSHNQKLFNAKESLDDSFEIDQDLHNDTAKVQTPKGTIKKCNNQPQKMSIRQDTVGKSPVRTIPEKRNQETAIKLREYPKKHSCQKDKKLSPVRKSPVSKTQSPGRQHCLNENRDPAKANPLQTPNNPKYMEVNSSREEISLDADKSDNRITQRNTEAMETVQNISLDDSFENDKDLHNYITKAQTPKGTVKKFNSQPQKNSIRQDSVGKSPVRTTPEKRNQELDIKSREYPKRHSCQKDNKLSPVRKSFVPKTQSPGRQQCLNEKRDAAKSKPLQTPINPKCMEGNSSREEISLCANESNNRITRITGTEVMETEQNMSLATQHELENDFKTIKRIAVVPKTPINASNTKEYSSKLPAKKRNNLAANSTNYNLDSGLTQKVKPPKKLVEIHVNSNSSLTVQRPPIELKVASTKLLRISKSLVEIGSKKRFSTATPHKSEMSFHEMVVSSKEETRISTLIQLDRFGSKSKAQSFCKSNAFSLDQYEDSVIGSRPYSSRLFLTKNFKGNEMSSYQRRKLYDEKIRRKMREKTHFQKDNNDQQIFEVRFLTMLNDEEGMKMLQPSVDMERNGINENNSATEPNLLQYLNENMSLKNVLLKQSETDQNKILNFCKNVAEVAKVLNGVKEFDVDSNVFMLLEHFCKSIVSYCDVTSTPIKETKSTNLQMDNNNKLEIIKETENIPDEDNNDVTIKYCSPAFTTSLKNESSELEIADEYFLKCNDTVHVPKGVSCPELVSHSSSFDFLYENNSLESLSKTILFDVHPKSAKHANNQFVNQYIVQNIPHARPGSPPRSEESGYGSVNSKKYRSRSISDFFKKSPLHGTWDFDKYHLLGIEERKLKMRQFKPGFDYCFMDGNFQEESYSQVIHNKEGGLLDYDESLEHETDLEPDVIYDDLPAGDKLIASEDEGPDIDSCPTHFSNQSLITENVVKKCSAVSCKIILSNNCLNTESATFVYPHCFEDDVIDDTVAFGNQDYLLRLNAPEKIEKLMGKKFFSNLLSVYEKEMEISRKLAEDDDFFKNDLLKLVVEQKDSTHSGWGLRQTRSKFASLFKRKKCVKFTEPATLEKQQCLNEETSDEYQGRLQSLAYNARRYFTMLVQAVKINQNINDEIKLCGLLKLLERIEKGDFKVLRREQEVNFEEEIKDQMRQAFISIYKISLAEAKKHKRILSNGDLELIRIFVSKYRIGLLSKTDIIASYIGKGLIKTESQLKAAVTYLMRSQTSNVRLCDFEEFCGLK